MTFRNSKNLSCELSVLALCILATLFSGANSFGQDGVYINKRPLSDFEREVRTKLESKSVDLTSPFEVEFKGKLDKGGKLDRASAKFTKTEGNKNVTDLVKSAILAVNDTGYFQYLSSLKITDVDINVRQTDSEVLANIAGELEDERKAKTTASSFAMMLKMAAAVNSENQSRTDDLLILNGTAVSSEAKKLLINIKLPKASVHEMLERFVAKQHAVPVTK